MTSEGRTRLSERLRAAGIIDSKKSTSKDFHKWGRSMHSISFVKSNQRTIVIVC